MALRAPLRVLPDLESFTVATPCTVPWESMAGNERTRHCGECDLDVHDLSKMTRAEAEELLFEARERGGRVCGRLYRRADGTVLTQDCPAAWQRLRRRVVLGASALAGIAGLAVVSLLALASFRRADAHYDEPLETKLLDDLVTAVTGREPPPRIYAGMMVQIQTPVPVSTPSGGSGATGTP